MPPVSKALAFISLVAILVAPAAAFAADAADWLRLKRAGDNAYGANNYGVAERTYQEALKQAEAFGNADVRLADTLHQLVLLHSTRGNFTKAEPLFERELRVREKALGGEHPDVVATVGRLAQFYIDHGSVAKADRLANLLASFADRKIKDQASVKDQFARLTRFYDKSKDYGEAKAILRKLEDSTAKTTANQDLELATTLDTLGRLYQGRNHFALAEKLFKNALLMREKTLAPTHLALAQSYENLSSLCTAQGKQELGQEYARKALDVTEKTLMPGRPEFFVRLDCLARAYTTGGQTDDAESLYKRGLELIDRTSPNSYDAGRASYALGMLYSKQGRFAAAEPLLKRALKTQESANGPEHAAVAPLLDSYADVLDKLNKAGEAAKLRARARAIRGVASATLPQDDF